MTDAYWQVGAKLHLLTEVSAEFVENVPDALFFAKRNALEQIQRHVANMTVDDIEVQYFDSETKVVKFDGQKAHFAVVDEIPTASPMEMFLGKEAYDQLMKELDLPPLKSHQLAALFKKYPPKEKK